MRKKSADQPMLEMFNKPKVYSSNPRTIAWREYSSKNRERVRQRNREWANANKQKMVEYKKLYAQRNELLLKARRKADYWKDRDAALVKARISNLKQKGWTIEEYETALIVQANRCAICQEEFSGKRRPHADHCHETKKKRELLCHFCNTHLGIFEHNRELFNERFPKYLDKWNGSA